MLSVIIDTYHLIVARAMLCVFCASRYGWNVRERRHILSLEHIRVFNCDFCKRNLAMCVRPWTECAECCQAMVLCPQPQQPEPPPFCQREQQQIEVAVECGECLRGMRAQQQQPPPQHAREQQQRALPLAACSCPHHYHRTPQQQMREEQRRGDRALPQNACSRPHNPSPQQQQMREEELQRGERGLLTAVSSRPHQTSPQQVREEEEELQRGEGAQPMAACSRTQQPSPQQMELEHQQQLSYEDFPVLRRRLQSYRISSPSEREFSTQQRETVRGESERHSSVEEEVRYKRIKVRVFPEAHF